MDLDELLARRHSVRAFLPDPVPEDTLRAVLGAAQRAPSWCNIQPWRVWVTSGPATRRLVDAIVAEAREGRAKPDVPFPTDYPEPYDTHRKACGRALYEAMGIARHDVQGRFDALRRNLRAFDAPHVAIVGLDRRFGMYAALDIGCWLQTLLLAATQAGVATCAQAALATFPAGVRAALPIPDEIAVFFGVALGYEDTAAAANGCRVDRSPLDANVVFVRE